MGWKLSYKKTLWVSDALNGQLYRWLGGGFKGHTEIVVNDTRAKMV